MQVWRIGILDQRWPANNQAVLAIIDGMEMDAEGPIVAFEVILERIPEPKAKPTRAKPALELSPFQPVERDFALVVERSVKAADIPINGRRMLM